VSVTVPGPAMLTQAGQLLLTRFPNPSGLSAEGRNLFAETASSGAPITATPGLNGLGYLLQGYLERSNVEVVNELINLNLAQRAYVFNTRAVQTSETCWRAPRL